MQDMLYNMIFKRKSFHIFKDIGTISAAELCEIEEKYRSFLPLAEDIKTAVRIVPAKATTCRRGQEYCILLYSEKKDNYLQNIGYIGEQLDLYLASKNIGSLWFGKNMYKSKRKTEEEIWTGDKIKNVTEVVRFAPSACNTQPWIAENTNGYIEVFRYKKPGKRGIMPADKVNYYNRIDIGIFLCFMDLCLNHENIEFEREIFADNNDNEKEKTLTAKYKFI